MCNLQNKGYHVLFYELLLVNLSCNELRFYEGGSMCLSDEPPRHKSLLNVTYHDLTTFNVVRQWPRHLICIV